MLFSLQIIYISLLISIIHLDVLVFGQFLLHRPIVVGPLIGFLLGIPQDGLVIGIIFELIYTSIIPVGIKVPPDATVAVAFSVMCYKFSGGCMVIPIIFGILCGFLYKYIDLFTRSLNSMVISWVDTANETTIVKRINLLIVYGLVTTYFKSLLFYLTVFPIASYLTMTICKLLSHCKFYHDLINLTFILPAVGVGIVLSHFTEK